MGVARFDPFPRPGLPRAPNRVTIRVEVQSMAICRSCERVLSANGSCLYCGTGAGAEAAAGRVGVRRVNWLRRILLLALAALLIHFFFISPTGRGIIRPLFESLGLTKYIPI